MGEALEEFTFSEVPETPDMTPELRQLLTSSADLLSLYSALDTEKQKEVTQGFGQLGVIENEHERLQALLNQVGAKPKARGAHG